MKYLRCKPDFEGRPPLYNIGDTLWHNDQEWTVWGLRWQDSDWHYYCQSQSQGQIAQLLEADIYGRLYRPPLATSLQYPVGQQLNQNDQDWVITGALYHPPHWDAPPCYVLSSPLGAQQELPAPEE